MRRYLINHPIGVDLESLDLKVVDKKMAAAAQSTAIALEENASKLTQASGDEADAWIYPVQISMFFSCFFSFFFFFGCPVCFWAFYSNSKTMLLARCFIGSLIPIHKQDVFMLLCIFIPSLVHSLLCLLFLACMWLVLLPESLFTLICHLALSMIYIRLDRILSLSQFFRWLISI